MTLGGNKKKKERERGRKKKKGEGEMTHGEHGDPLGAQLVHEFLVNTLECSNVSHIVILLFSFS